MQLQLENLIPKSYLLRKCGLLAHTSPAFLKNCWSKKLCVCLRLDIWKRCFERKRSFASGKRGFHPCFCLPACCNCPVALSEFATLILMIQLCLNWTVSKMQLQQENKVAKSNLLRKCGLLAHTSAAFLKNCCTEKLFRCLRLVFYNQLCFIWFLIRLHHNR